jgi:hypothetical protein
MQREMYVPQNCRSVLNNYIIWWKNFDLRQQSDMFDWLIKPITFKRL